MAILVLLISAYCSNSQSTLLSSLPLFKFLSTHYFRGSYFALFFSFAATYLIFHRINIFFFPNPMGGKPPDRRKKFRHHAKQIVPRTVRQVFLQPSNPFTSAKLSKGWKKPSPNWKNLNPATESGTTSKTLLQGH